MDCKKVEEGVVVLGDKKKALLSFLVRDVDIERTIKRRTEEKSTADNTLYFHTHTHTQSSVFSPILLTATFPLHVLTLPAASRSDI